MTKTDFKRSLIRHVSDLSRLHVGSNVEEACYGIMRLDKVKQREYYFTTLGTARPLRVRILDERIRFSRGKMEFHGCWYEEIAGAKK